MLRNCNLTFSKFSRVNFYRRTMMQQPGNSTQVSESGQDQRGRSTLGWHSGVLVVPGMWRKLARCRVILHNVAIEERRKWLWVPFKGIWMTLIATRLNTGCPLQIFFSFGNVCFRSFSNLICSKENHISFDFMQTGQENWIFLVILLLHDMLTGVVSYGIFVYNVRGFSKWKLYMIKHILEPDNTRILRAQETKNERVLHRQFPLFLYFSTFWALVREEVVT